ncbi:anti-sigma-W factor RsiW [Oxobacter pfennigii]|uniref:Anti-sigma-W factor RsiW n=1 Tax=Oxobacter pfennigii TaxID=36849 RepID=A0A0P8Y9R0_9CLOT|nr:zf-HC2 domain-containing protein [Oxobacter pfennigii]KPU43627.1 anti-sigma-W factor RsiW [Oxobacter pfennigii]
MDCRAADNLMMKYLDGDITQKEYEMLNMHLSSCESCKMEFEILRSAFFSIDNIKMEEAPENLERLVVSKIRSEKPVRAKNSWLPIAVSFLAVIMGWINIILVFRFTPAASIISDSFSHLNFLFNELFDLSLSLWKTIFTGSLKLLAMGRALDIARGVILETYGMAIALMILMSAVVLRLYGNIYRAFKH